VSRAALEVVPVREHELRRLPAGVTAALGQHQLEGDRHGLGLEDEQRPHSAHLRREVAASQTHRVEVLAEVAARQRPEHPLELGGRDAGEVEAGHVQSRKRAKLRSWPMTGTTSARSR
jgi:hypothetical protein